MKYIFDFDDVLFYNTTQFKEHMYECLEKAGVPREKAMEYYKEVREKEFSLKNFISVLFDRYNLDQTKTQKVYEDILEECRNFTNKELVEVVEQLGKNNCYLVSNGEKNFQQDKIKNSGITSLFCKIIIVPNSKREVIYDICDNKKEEVIFIEDKQKFIDDIDMAKCPNLKTVLFTSNALLRDALPGLFPHK